MPGNPELVAKYKNKIYCFVSEEKLEKFLRLALLLCCGGLLMTLQLCTLLQYVVPSYSMDEFCSMM